MYLVKRSIAIIRPKKLFLNWLNGMPDLDFELSLADIRVDCTVIMIPEVHEAEEGIAYIDELAPTLFEMELASWVSDEAIWPKNRTLKMFWEWFEVEIHREVIDSVKEEIVNSHHELH
jgi:hypothetical protein